MPCMFFCSKTPLDFLPHFFSNVSAGEGKKTGEVGTFLWGAVFGWKTSFTKKLSLIRSNNRKERNFMQSAATRPVREAWVLAHPTFPVLALSALIINRKVRRNFMQSPATPVTQSPATQGAESQKQHAQGASEQTALPRPVREAWVLAHPTFPDSRPGLLKAVILGLGQAAQSWHMHEASSEIEHERNRKIIITEATNGALISALFITVTTQAMFNADGVPQNGMQDSVAMTNLYYSLHTVATFCFAMSIIYSLTLLLIMESTHGKDASDISHALGVGIHWPITNFVVGILILLAAMFLKGYHDVSFWVWIVGIVIITLMLLVYFAFLGAAVQAQWDVMNHRLRSSGGTVKAASASKPERLHETTVLGDFVGSDVGWQCGTQSETNYLKLVQEWITQLPEIDETTKQRMRSAFQEDLVDVETLLELTTDDFLHLGVSKIGWQKKLIRKAKQEMVLRGIAVVGME